eukprot:m.87536 g.87536  ORF g.87536 m.87536 type:complete len:157 (+) comp26083_c0_seq1:56-526(+)
MVDPDKECDDQTLTQTARDAVSRAHTYFTDRGLSAVDVPKALVIHELMGASLLFGTWGLCYAVSPSKHMAIPMIRRFSVKNSVKFESTLANAQDKIRSFQWLKKIPGNPDMGKLSLALAESSLIRNCFRPITIPAKLWLTWWMIVPRNTQPNKEIN